MFLSDLLLVGIGGTLGLTALTAAWGPARRTTRIERCGRSKGRSKTVTIIPTVGCSHGGVEWTRPASIDHSSASIRVATGTVFAFLPILPHEYRSTPRVGPIPRPPPAKGVHEGIPADRECLRAGRPTRTALP
jgi:hypothetical protein